jgi:hypothetical protein
MGPSREDRAMKCDERSCSFEGNCYSEGSEVCGAEIDFGHCWVCKGGELEYSPRLVSRNYPERL